MLNHHDFDYPARREALYGPMREAGTFTWDRMYGEEYALADPYIVSRQTIDGLRRAAERLGAVYARTLQVARAAPDELLLGLGLPEASLAAARIDPGLDWATVIGRFDFAQTADGRFRMLEFNSDTPTSVVEAYSVNGEVCRRLGLRDPNEGCAAHLTEAFQAAVAQYQRCGYATERIVFSALDWHEEDAGTTRYMLHRSQLQGARFAPLADLRVQGDRLLAYGPDGELEPVDVLYRLHAIEKLAVDRDTDGYPTGEHVLRLVAEGKLALLNPPGAFIAQTKALQALIWSLYESGEFYTESEREAIAEHMLPTDLSSDRFEGAAAAAYVSKPIYGREGGAVTLYDAAGRPVERDGEEAYWEQPMVYQQRVELPEHETMTLGGPYRGRLLWGVFLTGGKASAIAARLGGDITNNLSYYVPIAIHG